MKIDKTLGDHKMRYFFGFVFFLLGVVGTADSTRAYDPIKFTLVNETSETMTAMYITLPHDRGWNRNIIGDGTKPRPGDEIYIDIDDRRPDCIYDVLMTFTDDKIIEDYEMDLCEMDGEVFSIRDEDLINADSGSDLYDVLRFLFK